jgi:HSP20 family molecular chaperone IbpA
LPEDLHISNIDRATAELEDGVLEVRFKGVYSEDAVEVKQTEIPIK